MKFNKFLDFLFNKRLVTKPILTVVTVPKGKSAKSQMDELIKELQAKDVQCDIACIDGEHSGLLLLADSEALDAAAALELLQVWMGSLIEDEDTEDTQDQQVH